MVPEHIDCGILSSTFARPCLPNKYTWDRYINNLTFFLTSRYYNISWKKNLNDVMFYLIFAFKHEVNDILLKKFATIFTNKIFKIYLIPKYLHAHIHRKSWVPKCDRNGFYQKTEKTCILIFQTQELNQRFYVVNVDPLGYSGENS